MTSSIAKVMIHYKSYLIFNHIHYYTHHEKLILITKISYPFNLEVVHYSVKWIA